MNVTFLQRSTVVEGLLDGSEIFRLDGGDQRADAKAFSFHMSLPVVGRILG